MRAHPPKRKAKIIQLGLEGHPPSALSRRFRIPRATIVDWFAHEKRRGVPIPSFKRPDAEERNHRKMIRLNRDNAIFFELEAKDRGFGSASRMINTILAVMVKEPNLIDAVLDDKE